MSSADSLEKSKINALLTLEKEGFDAISTVNITQVLSIYGYALDGKNYSALQDVYTDDVVANVATSPIIGLPALVRYYTETLGNIKTFRSSSSVLVFDITDTTATALSEGVAVYFGRGKPYLNTTVPLLSADDFLTFYERFEDKFTRGQDGLWKISERQLTILV